MTEVDLPSRLLTPDLVHSQHLAVSGRRCSPGLGPSLPAAMFVCIPAFLAQVPFLEASLGSSAKMLFFFFFLVPSAETFTGGGHLD